MKTEFTGNIVSVRAVEDAIRATRRYSESISTAVRGYFQGEEFSSRVYRKRYEVYPDVELDWDMPMGTALNLLVGNTTIIDISLVYDYRDNKAKLVVDGGQRELDVLGEKIPKFAETVAELCLVRPEKVRIAIRPGLDKVPAR